MSKYNVGDTLDVSQVFAVYQHAVVESIYTRPSGSVYMKVRGITKTGLSKSLHDLWEDEAGLVKVEKGTP